MEYIHKPHRWLTYQDNVSQTMKTTLTILVSELSPLPKIHAV